MRYFFDIRDDFYAADDDHGEEFASFDAAHLAALRPPHLSPATSSLQRALRSQSG
jgi:hypothetical protein